MRGVDQGSLLLFHHTCLSWSRRVDSRRNGLGVRVPISVGLLVSVAGSGGPSQPYPRSLGR